MLSSFNDLADMFSLQFEEMVFGVINGIGMSGSFSSSETDFLGYPICKARFCSLSGTLHLFKGACLSTTPLIPSEYAACIPSRSFLSFNFKFNFIHLI